MVTIKDIAQAASVSNTTVSRVLNNDQSFKVSDATREKVLTVAKQLGYKTVVERYSKKNFKLALVYKPGIFSNHLENDFHFSIRNGIDKVCARYGIDIVNVFRDSQSFSDNINGAIIQGNYTDEEIENMVTKLNTNRILIIGRSPSQKYDNVWFDTKYAIHSALDYLVELGHRDIGYMGNLENADLDMEDRRVTIFLRYMSSIPEFKSSRIYLSDHLRSGYELMNRILEDGPLPSAFFVANDPVAIRALDLLKERNIEVPETFSIVGLDGHQLTQYTTPPLTTVKIPTEYIGEVAIQTIIERIEGNRSLTKKVLVPTELIYRNSAKPFKKRL